MSKKKLTKPPKPPKLVVVKWRDAHADAEESLFAEDVDDFHKMVIVTSSGFLVRRDKTGITIAGCYDFFHDEIGYERSMFIEGRMVVSVRYMR